MSNSKKYPEIKITELKPYPKNARTHSPEQIEAICNSIREFGFLNPVIIDENNMILVGHGRVESAKVIGLETVPFVRVENLTDDQKRAYILADNKLSDLGGWDFELLQSELEDISLDMTLFGFDSLEIDEIPEPDDDIDDVTALEIDEPKSIYGDIYQLGDHFLMCGDSTNEDDIKDLLSHSKNGSCELFLSDPPYGIDIVNGGVSNKGKVGGAELSSLARSGGIKLRLSVEWGGKKLLSLQSIWLLKAMILQRRQGSIMRLLKNIQTSRSFSEVIILPIFSIPQDAGLSGIK